MSKKSRRTHGFGQSTRKEGAAISCDGENQGNETSWARPSLSAPSPYLLVPVLDQADEALDLGWSLLQEASLQLREAGGELALLTQTFALSDELDVDLGVRFVVFLDLGVRIVASRHLTC